METVEITVAQIVPPDAGTKRPYAIKDDMGGEYKAWGEQAQQLIVGRQYRMEVEPKEWAGKFKSGTDYMVKKVEQLTRTQYPPPAPSPKPQGGVGFRPPVTDSEKLDMRVTSWGHALINGNPGPFMQPGAFRELAIRLKSELSDARSRTNSPQRADDMDDDIPY